MARKGKLEKIAEYSGLNAPVERSAVLARGLDVRGLDVRGLDVGGAARHHVGESA